MLTPSSRASSSTVSQTRQSGVRSWSRRFIESCTQPWEARSMPSACTAGSPPSRSRTRDAIRRATRDVGRGELDVQGDERTDGPRRRWPRPSDAVGQARSRALRRARPMASARPSKPGRRMSTRTRRSGPQGGLAVQVDGQLEALGQAPRRTSRAPSTHCSMVVSPSGTKGTTSTAPMRGWLPWWRAHVDALDGHLDGALQRLS